MELHKRRKALTEPEVRYFLRQTLLGLHYLHTEKVTTEHVHQPSGLVWYMYMVSCVVLGCFVFWCVALPSF